MSFETDESEQRTKSIYDNSYAEGYRAYDEQFITTKSYRHYRNTLTVLSSSFDHPISVLDIGCGTGRFFHTLINTNELTGIDVSASMLELARDPLKKNEINIPYITLTECNIHSYDFGGRRFDFIYSVGVLGEHTSFGLALCNKIYDLLLPGGKAFFTIVDLDSKKSIKRKLADVAYLFMPPAVKRKLDARWQINFLTYKQLDTILRASKFINYNIHHHVAKEAAWKGAHHECVVVK
jgi:ubiquinone/menaquinone biosynthesis C-methylase UbiE